MSSRGTRFGALALLLSISSLSLVACSGTAEDDADVGDDEAAVLARDAARGRSSIHFPSPTTGAPDELCVLPKHLPGGDYKKDDDKSETELCSYSYYGTRPREANAPMVEVAICPKLSSTNPGTDVQELLPGKTREQTEAEICSKDDRPTKLLAKYKQSITCSYAPSILGYYHLSRALGGVGDVKPAVVRTMDLAEHKKITAEALQILRNQGAGDYPKASWLSFQSAEANPAGSSKKDALYTDDLKQLFGGLQENARGEAKFSEINKRGAEPNIIGPFTRTPQYANLVDARPIATIAGRSLAQSAQIVVTMKDLSDMLLIDYLMSQQDRFGNIHELDYYYFTKPDGSLDKVKKSKVDDGSTPMPAGGVLVKKLLLKDNDCGGPSKTNHVKNAGILKQLRHMNAGTYKNLRWMAANFGRGSDSVKFFMAEALFQQADVDMLRTNLTQAAADLHDMCVSGKLLLDADLGDHLKGRAHDPASCEASGPPSTPAPQQP